MFRRTAVACAFLVSCFGQLVLGESDFLCDLGGLNNVGEYRAPWVASLYLGFLGREPSASESSLQIQQLKNGTTYTDLALMVYQSDEHVLRLVRSQYQTFLGRDLEPQLEAPWLDLFRQGLDEREVTATLLSSPEYIQKSGGLTEPFLDAVFQALLGRPIDPSALAYFSPLVQKPGGPRQVVESILYEKTYHEYTDRVIDSAYVEYLGRAASPSDTATLVNAVLSPLGIRNLKVALVASEESRKRYLASARIQRCLDSAPQGASIGLSPPGVYILDRSIELNRSGITLSSEGMNVSDAGCTPSSANCVQLQAAADFLSPGGLLHTNGRQTDVVIHHLVFNGNKEGRRGSEAEKKCQQGQGTYGINLFLGLSESSFIGNASINTLCATSAGFDANAQDRASKLVIQRNLFANNGVHGAAGLLSDGLTQADATDSIISDNVFRDNTDVALISGGCSRCQITSNTIEQTAQGAYAGLMIQQWPNQTSGDFTDTDVSTNTIVSATDKGLGFGLYIGGQAWYPVSVTGGQYHDNHIENAQVGLAIDDSASMDVFNNTVVGTLAGQSFKSTCGRPVQGLAFAVSSSTTHALNLHGNQQGSSAAALSAASWADFTFTTGCVPNAW